MMSNENGIRNVSQCILQGHAVQLAELHQSQCQWLVDKNSSIALLFQPSTPILHYMQCSNTYLAYFIT